MIGHQSTQFKMDTAREMADSFFVSTGIACGLYSSDGELLYAGTGQKDGCIACRELSDAAGMCRTCEGMHKKAISQAERFGGRYIYFCPAYMMYIASPIMCEGNIRGALVAGPILTSDVEEYLENDPRTLCITDPDRQTGVRQHLSLVPFAETKRVNELSKQLFANAVFIGDESREMLIAQSKNNQQSSIGEFIHQLKHEGNNRVYPINTENELFQAISRGDNVGAARLLNEILGYIFFYTGGKQKAVQARVTELVVMLSRAAISGGANVEEVLSTTEQYMQELRQLNKLDDIAIWLADMLNYFTSLVFDVVNLKHKNAIYAAVDYIRQNYTRAVTLEEVADHAGYSYAYFSNMFKEEMNCGFHTYLNRVRIEKSKPLLLTGKCSIAEICEMTGFSDQSTFGKIFRQETGISPGKYRKANRRIDVEKEHGMFHKRESR